jgi:hypothetical protein
MKKDESFRKGPEVQKGKQKGIEWGHTEHSGLSVARVLSDKA